MRRMVAIVVVLGPLLIVPALCEGGVITHACDCADQTCCPPECDCIGDSGCRHSCKKGDCSGDPCSLRFVRTGRQGDPAIEAPEPATSASPGLCEGGPFMVRTALAQFPFLLKSMRRNNQPYPPSDLPLLI